MQWDRERWNMFSYTPVINAKDIHMSVFEAVPIYLQINNSLNRTCDISNDNVV